MKLTPNEIREFKKEIAKKEKRNLAVDLLKHIIPHSKKSSEDDVDKAYELAELILNKE